jgi:hypothetical protein
MRQPFRDTNHAALARVDALEAENTRMHTELAVARAELLLQEQIARSLSPQRAFVRAMVLAATMVAVALLVATLLASAR